MEEILLGLIQCHFAGQSCLPYFLPRHWHDQSQGPPSGRRYPRPPGLNGTTWAGPTAASPPACSRARERARLPGSQARLAATHRAARPGGRAIAGRPKSGVLAVALIRHQLNGCGKNFPNLIETSRLRGFAPSREPVISARPARGPSSTGQPETAPKTYQKVSLRSVTLWW